MQHTTRYSYTPDRPIPGEPGYELTDYEHGTALCELITAKLRAPCVNMGATDLVSEALGNADGCERLALDIGNLIADAIDGSDDPDQDAEDAEIGRRVRMLVVGYVASVVDDDACTLAADHRAARDDDARWAA